MFSRLALAAAILIMTASVPPVVTAADPLESDLPPLQLPAALRHPMMPPASSLVPRDSAGLLATLLQPIETTDFMDTYYERTSLHVARNKPDYFAELRKATMESFDPMLAAFRDANVLSRGIQVWAQRGRL
jgi:hypothetical protein